MTRRRGNGGFWAFVGENIVALATVVAGIGVIIWQAVAAPADLDPVSVAVLGLLCLLATSEMVESRKRLERLQQTLDDDLSRIMALLPMAEVRRFIDSESAFAFLCEKTDMATVSIDHASLDCAVRSRAKQSRDRYTQVRNETIKAGNIRYRYLFYPSEAHIRKVGQWLEDSHVGKFFAASTPGQLSAIPMMVFVIIDNAGVFVRSPYEVGEDEVYLYLQHPGVIALFSQWFRRLWATSVKIDPRLSYEEQLAQLDGLTGSMD